MSNDAPTPLLRAEEREEEGETGHVEAQRRETTRAAPRNADTFWDRLYAYYAEKGFTCIVLSRLFELLSLGFTIGFSSFLLAFVNWTELLTTSCRADQPCWRDVHAIREAPFSNVGMKEFGILLYMIVFSVYWLWKSMCFFGDVFGAFEIRRFYNMDVGLSDTELQGMEWNAVLEKIKLSQISAQPGIGQVAPLDVAARLMRRENYLIALVNRGVLDLRLPFLPAYLAAAPTSDRRKQQDFRTSELTADGLPEQPPLMRQAPLTDALIWNLNFCIFDRMFGAMYRIHPEFLNAEIMRRRFQIMGILNFILMPFIVVFLVMRFILLNAQQFYVSPSLLGKREWTVDARWRFREFNELPHFFAKRLAAACPPANSYLSMFPSFALGMFARFAAFVSGALAAVLIVAGVLDQNLLASEAGGKPLWWWLALFGAIVAVCRALSVDDSSFAGGDATAVLTEVVKHTHYLPHHWQGHFTSWEVHGELSLLFQFKLVSFVQDVLAVFLNPYILYYSLPRCAEDIVQFVRDFTVEVRGLGHVCSFGLFDVARHGNPKYGGQQLAKAQRSRGGKLEKSLLSFIQAHPGFDPGEAGRDVLARLAEQTEKSPSLGSSSARSFVSARGQTSTDIELRA
eukprot:tig00000912_g5425.t1